MTPQDLAIIQSTIEELLRLMDVQGAVTVELGESQVIHVEIQGDNLGILIGYHGETLSALQTVVGLIVNRDIRDGDDASRFKVVVNVGDYRERQREALEALARRSAERVRFTRKPLELPFMSSYDRRIVHLALEREHDLESESVGEGRERRLVVKLRDF
jgi:spoIIIJ-associated protein